MLKGRGEIKQVEFFGNTLQRIVEVSRLFCIVYDKHMVELLQRRMVENRRCHELRRAAQQVFEIDPLSLGKRKPVRQLKKAGIIDKLLLQQFKIHRQQRYLRNGQLNGWHQMK